MIIIPTNMQKTAICFLSLLLVLPRVTTDSKKEIFTSARCPPVAEGDYGAITFFSERPVNISTELIFYVKKDDGPDLVSCHLKAEESTADCKTFNENFKAEEMVRGNLTIAISNATKNHQGEYVLHVFSKELYHNPVACQFNILEGGDNTKQRGTGRYEAPILAAVIGTIAIVLGLICVIWVVIKRHKILVFLHLKRKRFKRERQKEPTLRMVKSGSCSDSEHSPEDKETSALIAEGNNIQEAAVVHGEKDDPTDWEAIKEVERRLLQRKGPGSFLIRNNPTDQTYDRLAVNSGGKVELFATKKEKNSVVLEDAKMSFQSQSVLVNYYKENEITTVNKDVFCKLSLDVTQAFEREVEWMKPGCRRHSMTERGDVGHEHSQPEAESMDLLTTSRNDHAAAEVDREQLEKGIPFNNNKYPLSEAIDPGKRQPNSTATEGSENDKTEHSDNKTVCVRNSHEEEKQQRGNLSPHSTDSSVDPKCAPAKDGRGVGLATSERKLPNCEDPLTKNRPASTTEQEDEAWGFASKEEKHSDEDIDVDGKIGYFEDVTDRKAEKDLLEKNGAGSFLIRPSRKDEHKILAVCWSAGKFVKFKIVKKENRLFLPDTGEAFDSFSDLVEHYKENDIKTTKGDTFGRLSRPCSQVDGNGRSAEVLQSEKSPAKHRPSSPTDAREVACTPKSTKDHQYEEDRIADSNIGYFEDIKTAAADRELLSGLEYGSFLIRPGWDEQHKILAVNFYGSCVRFAIEQEENYVVLQGTDRTFHSLSDLVKHYQTNVIPPVKGKSHGKLSHPCHRVPPKKLQNQAASKNNAKEVQCGEENSTVSDDSPPRQLKMKDLGVNIR